LRAVDRRFRLTRSGRAWTSFVKKQVRRGYAVVSANYRLTPAISFPANLHDVKRAIRWLRANTSTSPTGSRVHHDLSPASEPPSLCQARGPRR